MEQGETMIELIDHLPGNVVGIVARGRVVKAGRTLTVAQSEVFARDSGQEKLIALLTASIMTVANREGIND